MLRDALAPFTAERLYVYIAQHVLHAPLAHTLPQVVTGARVSVAEGADRSHPGSVSLSTGQQLPADLAIW